MTLPRPRTVRARLTLFTMLVTGVLLALIVLIVDVGARRTLLGAVDSELLRQARGMANGPAGRGGPRRPPDRNGDGPRDFRGDGPDRDDGREGDGPTGPPRSDQTGSGNSPASTSSNNGTNSGSVADRHPVGDRAATGTPTIEDVHPLDFPPEPRDQERDRPYDSGAIARARSGTATFSERELNGKVYRLYTFPIRRGGEIVRVSQIPSELTTVTSSLDRLRRTLLQIVLPIGVLLAGLASLLLVDRFMRPLRQISGEAERIGETDLKARLPIVGEDEFAGLSTTLNGMLGRLQTAFLRERAELQRQRGFTADASHELKTPLAVIKANAGLMLHLGGSPEEMHEWADEIDGAATRMTGLVNDMLVLARAEAGDSVQHYAPCDLREVIKGTGRALGVGEDRIVLALPNEAVTVFGSGNDLTRVLVNLVGNALKHSGATVPVEIALRTEGGQAQIAVTDRGKGIEAKHLPHLFDRFYRVDVSRSSETGGTGLGLAIVKGIVEAHGGTITAASQMGRGTTFLVRLPLAQ